MGGTKEGWDGSSLGSVGMIPSKVGFPHQRRGSSSGAGPGRARAVPLSAVLIRRDQLTTSVRPLKSPSYREKGHGTVLGSLWTLLAPIRGCIKKKERKKKLKGGAHQALAAEKCWAIKLLYHPAGSGLSHPLPNLPLNFSFQEGHKPGFVLYQQEKEKKEIKSERRFVGYRAALVLVADVLGCQGEYSESFLMDTSGFSCIINQPLSSLM